MRINLLSSFAAGVLLTTSICSVVYLTDDNSTKKEDNHKTITVQTSVKEMEQKLVAKGYVVQKKADYEKSLKAANEKTAKTVTKVTINVTEGMTSIDVGNILVPSGIVSNAFEFSKTIEQRGLSNKLRPGTYVVDTEMSFDQVVATIFK
ncbi:cell division protein YceG involved in septum cleavage [Bacillus sp. SORGH_AS 510]|uniref:aminodeoxychorismate lyase n=1 Tax=Bacillus sp. SORGH_AS_0510 TaxID=3041771 RepID=UPI002783E6A4|nr:aminodeoxychorismate lyase [Bacillus sp. SORGH_AS_0510]MDQ1145750.1 cell division protein YceG involved in septum cleavage [Bacillus sp. SORGH_AS_0510]